MATKFQSGLSNMDAVEEALAVVETALEQGCLNDIQELVFRQAWEGRTYLEIAESFGYDADYIKNVGAELWKLLSNSLGKKVTKSNLHSVFRKTQQVRPLLDTENFDVDSHNTQANPIKAAHSSFNLRKMADTCQDWVEAVDVSIFFGRLEELATLEQWIVKDHCRLVALVGMRGISDTALAAKLVEEVQDKFDATAQTTKAMVIYLGV